MHEQIVLGFDFGMKRIGVAVGQTSLKQANALKTLAAKQGVPNWNNVKKLVTEWNAKAFIVGLPIQMNGSEQAITQAAKQFGKELAMRFNLPVYHVDERLTTVEARQQLFDQGGYKKLQSTDIDGYAAMLILEQWLTEQVKSS